MILFEDVSKQYKNKVMGLDHVDFHIQPGEFVFLIGPSGAGKSTLVQLLMKNLNPDTGRIFFNGREITKLPQRRVPMLRREIGVVFQGFRLLEDMTVFENIEYVLNLLGLSRKKKREKIKYLLELVGLEDRSKSYPNQLSGGEQQRVSIARAMAVDPVLLVADEPTGNLDPETARSIMRSFEAINQTGTTILVSTHAKDIVDEMQKRVIQLSHGKIVRDEQHANYEDPRFPHDMTEADHKALFDETTSFPRVTLEEEMEEEIEEADDESNS